MDIKVFLNFVEKPVLPTLHDVYAQKATDRHTDWDMFGLKATERGMVKRVF